MTDLMPPPRRSPDPVRARRMREMLQHEANRATQPHSAVRTFAPWLAAAAVAAIALTGVVLIQEDGSTPQPATPATSTGPDATRQTAPDRAAEAEAYGQCRRLIGGQVSDPAAWEAAGALLEEGSTVVALTNGSKVVACNLDPDRAVSTTHTASDDVNLANFEVAHNVTSNVVPGARGEYTWAAGAVPDGVTEISYTFPDGHVEEATIDNGYWLMQYVSPRSFTTPGQSVLAIDPIKVTVSTRAGPEEFELDWGLMTCAQVTHGC